MLNKSEALSHFVMMTISKASIRSKARVLSCYDAYICGEKIRHREKQHNSARKIRFLRGKMKSGSTTMVTVNENGIQRDLTKKHEIEQAIMLNNMEKYKQSFHTPFMTSPLKEEFGFKGLTTAAQAVLGGVYEPSTSIDKHTKEFIEELEMPQAVRVLGPQKMEIEVELSRPSGEKPKKILRVTQMTSPLPL
jgi:hypothetical protein